MDYLGFPSEFSLVAPYIGLSKFHFADNIGQLARKLKPAVCNASGREPPKPLEPTSKEANLCAESLLPLDTRCRAEPFPLTTR